MGRGKGDDLSDKRLISGRMGNYKGRPKGEDWKFLKVAVEIIEGDTLEDWQREFNISRSEYDELRYRLFAYDQAQARGFQGSFSIPQGFSTDAVKKMQQENKVLQIVLGNFYNELDKANEKGNTVYLNIVREIFGEAIGDRTGPFPPLPMYEACKHIDAPKGRGDKIKKETILKAYKLFVEWTKGIEDLERPKTFYGKEKFMGFCRLACLISDRLDAPFHGELYNLTRLRVTRQMQLLIRRANQVFLQNRISDPRKITPLLTHMEKACVEIEKIYKTLKDM